MGLEFARIMIYVWISIFRYRIMQKYEEMYQKLPKSIPKFHMSLHNFWYDFLYFIWFPIKIGALGGPGGPWAQLSKIIIPMHSRRNNGKHTAGKSCSNTLAALIWAHLQHKDYIERNKEGPFALWQVAGAALDMYI